MNETVDQQNLRRAAAWSAVADLVRRTETNDDCSRFADQLDVCVRPFGAEAHFDGTVVVINGTWGDTVLPVDADLAARLSACVDEVEDLDDDADDRDETLDRLDGRFDR
jgi:hypothetical protein